MENFLNSTYFIDSDSDLILKTALDLTTQYDGLSDKAKKLFYWTRDEIIYDAYNLSSIKKEYKASKITKGRRGWCVQKATVLAALARSIGIPARLHFADIRNYQTPEKLKNIMGSNIFLYHGYTDLYLNGKWVKATPAFNKGLCKKFGYKTVEFDGYHDAILPETTLNGEKYIEYLKDRGTNFELPFKEIFATFLENYPMNKNEKKEYKLNCRD